MLLARLDRQLRHDHTPAALITCLTNATGPLPIAQVKLLANAGEHPPPNAQAIAYKLLPGCVRKGIGVEFIRSLVFRGISSAETSSVPSALRDCLVTQFEQLSNRQLVIVAGGPTYWRPLVARLDLTCLGQPGVLAAARTLFLEGIQHSISQLPAQIRGCFLARARALSTSLVRQTLIAGLKSPIRAQQSEAALGARIARACVSVLQNSHSGGGAPVAPAEGRDRLAAARSGYFSSAEDLPSS